MLRPFPAVTLITHVHAHLQILHSERPLLSVELVRSRFMVSFGPSEEPIPVQRSRSAPATPPEKVSVENQFLYEGSKGSTEPRKASDQVRVKQGRPHSEFFKYGLRRQQQQGWIRWVYGSRAHILACGLTLAVTALCLSVSQQGECGSVPCRWVPAAVCTSSQHEYCFLDAGCDEKATAAEVQEEHPSWVASQVASWMDTPRTNRSGCNAGGVHQRCRFCGFGAHAPCPASAMWLPHIASVVSLAIMLLNWQCRDAAWIGFVTAGYLLFASVYLW